ncbi:hypothetical protein ACFE04_025275 [Oxalis oulophora]
MSSYSMMMMMEKNLIIIIIVVVFISASTLHASSPLEINSGDRGRRLLVSFKETPKGSNLTFECSPSGPCVPCQYSEKNDEKYRCSETGYRIPMKCVQTKATKKKDGKKKKSQNAQSDLEISHSEKPNRRLLDDSSVAKSGPQAYITYRSCIQAVNEEKLSVLGFEGIVLFLFVISGSAVYFRKKQSVSASGFARIPTNPRF